MNTKRLARIAAASSFALIGISAMAGPAMAADSDTTGPSDVLQSVGMPASGTCAAVDDTGLDIAGVSSGGWAQGWGQWLNNGAGGVTCNRTLTYDNSSGTWVVAA